ncbi:VOC family protein [Knoellia sp. 3-2P3]|uniref:VOC family protein n=1 Tax=unclassified Knoellia TaxID=2618719 RepID=UPI0023D9A0DA|nr:VOC family protein [Knoellia sp. 3-2P3]MDF2090713.1 VOC family protein [Knoellia sp. 3-2P3]
MSVRWVWLFLDLPEQCFETALAFWQQVARSGLSPWRGEHREFATLLPADGDPWLKLQRVGGDGGIHLDLDVEQPLPEAAERAVGLGAAVVGDFGDVIVCRSPGGFVFCLTRWPAEESARGQARAGAESLIDQVCLDVPSSGYAAELAFWSQLTGWAVDDPDPDDEFARLAWPSGMPVRFLLQRLDEPQGTVRGHVDLCAVDRAAEVERHRALGARVEGEGRGWTVMQGPAGHRYCVTDRDPRRGP